MFTEMISPIKQEESWYISQTRIKSLTGYGDNGSRQYGISYFGRLSYNYDDKYLLYATMRADGSSKYQQKWGYFPTVGVGWVISEEDFMQDNNLFDFLKLRQGLNSLEMIRSRQATGQLQLM